MKTQVIYDDLGFVLSITQGDPEPRNPVGIPFLLVDIPEGKRIKITDGVGVDVSETPHQVILEDIPLSEMNKLNSELEKTQLAIAELAEFIIGGM